MNNFKEDLQKTLDAIISKPHVKAFCWTNEQKEILKHYYPEIDIEIIPQKYKSSILDTDKVYIIPTDNGIKPVKYIGDIGDNPYEVKLNGFGCWEIFI